MSNEASFFFFFFFLEIEFLHGSESKQGRLYVGVATCESHSLGITGVHSTPAVCQPCAKEDPQVLAAV